ncbi:hypothetical protein FOL46_009209 [Perkinsus olseni]|uniref:Uncharacterized protein n=1 Tax=Perkinsus olseni TaxID=32597 RepID=A0A7J6L3Q4_PEROL|nr:hypothetical protein FOL46_009209 [Perkinsus olseni]
MDNYQTCLSWEFVEVACGLLDRVSPEMADVLFLQGYNHRLGTSGLNMMEIVKATDVLYPGFSGILPALPEQDQWEYPTHHDGQPIRGPARVCSALVCEMLRAGGVFGNHDVSCTEFTPWDIYSMDVFTSPTYQLKGDYAIDLTKPEPLRLGQKRAMQPPGIMSTVSADIVGICILPPMAAKLFAVSVRVASQ